MRNLAMIVCMVFLFTILPAKAAESSIQINQATVDMQTGKIVIAGSLSSKQAGKEVALRVFNAGMDAADLEIDALALQKIDQVVSGEGGSFSFPPFSPNADSIYFQSGALKYYVDCDGAQVSGTVYVAAQEDVASALDRLRTALEEGASVETVLAETDEALALHTALYDAVSIAALANLLEQEYAEQPSCIESAAALQQTMQRLALMQAYNEGKTALVVSGTTFLYPEILQLDTLDEKENIGVYMYYSEKLPEDAQATVISGLCGRQLRTLDDFYKAFAQMVVLQGISHPKQVGWGHVRDLLTQNGAYAGLDLSAYLALSDTKKDQVDAALASETFESDFEALESALAKAVKDVEGSGSTGGNGSTGGGGRGSGSSGGNSSSGTPIRVDNDIVQPPIAETETFHDLAGYDWAKDAIETLYGKNIVNGVGSGQFQPAGQTTREQFVKMFVQLAGAEVLVADQSFSDVDSNAWYASYLTTAKQMGIIEGRPDGSFGVGEPITRQDVMVMLKRGLEAMQVIIPEGTPVAFTDQADTAAYAVQAVEQLSAAGIVVGDDTGAFRPNDTCSRAETAVIFSRVLALL